MSYALRNDQAPSERTTDALRSHLRSALQSVDLMEGTQPVAEPIGERAVREVLKLRRSRARYFDAELFADPAWDILLELYAAELGQQRQSVSSICIGADVPQTTALRWIALLEKKGLIRREADRFDGRRVFLMLTNTSREAMARFFGLAAGRITPI